MQEVNRTTMTNRLLIVDDELFIRELLHEMCTNLGYEVHVAGSLTETKTLINIHDFDAAVVDLRLAETSGLEVVKAIKDRNPDVSVVMMTGYPTVDTILEGMRLGITDCIVKPFRLREIAKTIADACMETQRRVEIRGLRERVAALEARTGSTRSSRRRVVIRQPAEQVTAEESATRYINRVISETNPALVETVHPSVG